MARDNSGNGGCGCIILIILAIGFVINKCNAPKETHQITKNKTSTVYPKTTIGNDKIKDVDDYSLEETMQYLENSFFTGDTPYAQFYGENYKCPYSQCSGIKVTAPEISDVIVTIKRNNENGKVIAHGYINAGDTYQFDIPDGIYQTFFYYGKGWNPNKVIKDGITGGFVKNEVISKDDPQEIYSGILSYILQLRQSGNFQTQGSNFEEAF